MCFFHNNHHFHAFFNLDLVIWSHLAYQRMFSDGQIDEYLSSQRFNDFHFYFYKTARDILGNIFIIMKIFRHYAEYCFFPSILFNFGMTVFGGFYFKTFCINKIILSLFYQFYFYEILSRRTDKTGYKFIGRLYTIHPGGNLIAESDHYSW